MTEKRKLLVNSISVLTNRLVQSITTFVLVAAIARILGASELGQYMLAFSYYYVFMTLASQGLKVLFTRELSLHPSETPVYLVSGTLLQLIFCLIGYAALAIVVFLLPYSADTSKVCYILGLAIIPFSLSNITESIFQAQEKMYLIAVSTVPVYILRLLVIIWAINLKYDVSMVSVIMVASETIILLIEWAFIFNLVTPSWTIKWDFIWKNTKASGTFLAIEGISVLNDRMQILILSLLGGEVVVGLYGSIMQLMQPFQIISHSLILAVFPKMSKAVELGRQKQRDLAEKLVEILLMVALPFITGLFFIGHDLLLFVYRDPKFADATFALNIISLGLIVSCFGRPLSYALIVNNFERINLIDVVSTSLFGGLISIFMVSQYKLNGAAIAVLIVQILTINIYLYYVYKLLFRLRLLRIIIRPILITTLMAIVFLTIQKISQDTLIFLIVSSAAYIILISIFGVYYLGGISAVKNQLFRKNKES